MLACRRHGMGDCGVSFTTTTGLLAVRVIPFLLDGNSGLSFFGDIWMEDYSRWGTQCTLIAHDHAGDFKWDSLSPASQV